MLTNKCVGRMSYVRAQELHEIAKRILSYASQPTLTGSLTVRENKPFQRRSDLINPTDFLDGAVVNDN